MANLPKVLIVDADPQRQTLLKMQLENVADIVFVGSIGEAERTYVDDQENEIKAMVLTLDIAQEHQPIRAKETIGRIRSTFKGPMIGASFLPEIREMFEEVGCDLACERPQISDAIIMALNK